MAKCLDVVAQTDDELYQSIFGIAKQPKFIEVELVFDLQNIGGVMVKLDSRERLESVDSALLCSSLSSVMREEELYRIDDVCRSEQVAAASLKNAGVDLTLDLDRFVLTIDIASEIRKPVIRSYRSAPYVSEENIVYPAFFAGYLNYSYRQDWLSDEENNQWANSYDAELVVNVGGVVFESGVDYSRQNELSLKDSLLTYDDEERAIRYRLGEIKPNASSLMDTNSLAGISIAREFGVAPYLSTLPTHAETITLDEKSEVIIYLNDRVYDRLILSKGVYSIQDLALDEGVNEVRLEVLGFSGKREVMMIQVPVSSKLLAENQTEFGLSLGVPYTEDGVNRRYLDSTRKLIGNTYYLYGIDSNWSLGGFGQFSEESYLFGIESHHATLYGNTSFEWAWRNNYSLENGLRAIVSYEYFFSDSRLSHFRFEHELECSGYPGDSLPEQGDLMRSAFTLSGNLSDSTRISLEASKVSPDSSKLQGSYATGIRANQSWPDGVYASLYFKNEKDDQGESSFGLDVSISWHYGANNRFAFSNQVENDRKRFSWSGGDNKKLKLDAATINERLSRGQQFNARYDMSKLATAISVDHTKSKTDGSNRESGLVSASGAIVFGAEGYGLSRRVSDSFALVQTNEYLATQKLGVNPGTGPDTHQDYASDYMNAVIPGLSSYRFETLTLDGSTLDSGYSIERERYTLKPTFKSGIFLEAGKEASVVLIGHLSWEGEERVGLRQGVAVSKHSGERTAFFTNRKGKFVLEGVIPGQYELTLSGLSHRPVTVYIPKGQKGFYIHDEIILKPKDL